MSFMSVLMKFVPRSVKIYVDTPNMHMYFVTKASATVAVSLFGIADTIEKL